MAELDPFLADITRVALVVANRHGFALGGGNALRLHGLIDRPTTDVDLFTDREHAVRAAADLVLRALADAGLNAIEVTGDSDLDIAVYGLDDLMIDIEVTDGERTAQLSLATQPRAHAPIVMALGPVIHLDDLIAGKVSAIVNRREIRDYIDTAAFLADHDVTDLLAAARRVDPGMEDEDIVMVGRVLDDMPDRSFARYGLEPAAVAQLRQRFTAWPR
jgi:hypothetical protein